MNNENFLSVFLIVILVLSGIVAYYAGYYHGKTEVYERAYNIYMPAPFHGSGIDTTTN